VNFLAHLFLSGNDAEIMVGNFIGDFVRGKYFHEQYPPSIALGIELHREIDEFTDNHSVVLESKKRLRPKYRHYSPVIIDMFYDHFLAKNWSTYSTNPLDQYAQDAYAILNKYATIVPDQVGRLLPYMIQGNWLYNYSSIEGIHRALSGMAQRTPYNSKMEEASLDLKEHYDSFQNEFLRFFPELQSFCTEYLESKTNAT
jgi:acyl carrier protein phosphodiesterase